MIIERTNMTSEYSTQTIFTFYAVGHRRVFKVFLGCLGLRLWYRRTGFLQWHLTSATATKVDIGDCVQG